LTSSPSASPVTARARAFVAEKLPVAERIGAELASLIEDPERFAARLEDGFRALTDSDYLQAQAWVAPGVGPVLGVRAPLAAAVARPVRRALRSGPAAYSVYLAERLVRSDYQEVRLFSHHAIERSLPDDPERSWQLIRRLARRAGDWDSVDHLADLVARGILFEPYRWAEIEQLVYSPHRWERRLVASTIARLPSALPRARRAELAETPALDIIGTLIGDGDDDVQKALGWALRSWTAVDPEGVDAFLEAEAAEAARTGDGNRAWVIRDVLPSRPAEIAASLRGTLGTVRRRAGTPSTSRAAEVARSFSDLPDAHELADAPLTR
jgi:3-methyladenine DNA glycosylase AlkD